MRSFDHYAQRGTGAKPLYPSYRIRLEDRLCHVRSRSAAAAAAAACPAHFAGRAMRAPHRLQGLRLARAEVTMMRGALTSIAVF